MKLLQHEAASRRALQQGANAIVCVCVWSLLQAVTEGLGRVLDAIGTATIVIGMIKQHHGKVIQPQLQSSAGEAAACSSALSGLVRSVEERVLTCLQQALNAFLSQVHPQCYAMYRAHLLLLMLLMVLARLSGSACLHLLLVCHLWVDSICLPHCAAGTAGRTPAYDRPCSPASGTVPTKCRKCMHE